MRTKTVLICVVLYLALLVGRCAAACGATILQQDFNTFPGAYKSSTAASAKALWPDGGSRISADGKTRTAGLFNSIGINRLQVGDGQAKVQHAKGVSKLSSCHTIGPLLDVHTPATSAVLHNQQLKLRNMGDAHVAGCFGLYKCGAGMSVRLTEVLTEATMTYNLKFEEGFDWTYGGKLPGLCSEGRSNVQPCASTAAIQHALQLSPLQEVHLGHNMHMHFMAIKAACACMQGALMAAKL